MDSIRSAVLHARGAPDHELEGDAASIVREHASIDHKRLGAMRTIALSPEGVSAASDQMQLRRVAWASLVGTTIEWYDFLIYATMAGIIFNQYFFPRGDAFVSTMLAYG